jgi:apolipoprotein N-acyltransferase
VILYGVFRMQQKTISRGPRVAVIQDNIPQRVKDDPKEIDRCYERYLKLAREASGADPAPDLVAWPETMIPGPINVEWMHINPLLLSDYGQAQMVKLKADDAALRELATSTGAAQLVGVPGLLPRRDSNIPLRENLAILYLPDTGPASPYYVKHHLVPFGEYLPFSDLPIVGKYMVKLMPYGIDPTNVAGTEWTRFQLPVTDRFVTASQPGLPAAIVRRTRYYTFGTPI